MEKALYDPRSYLAKSVPKRMAIISAGVIMNVIFAFFMAIGGLLHRREASAVRRGRLDSRRCRLARGFGPATKS